ncbi:VOC family protein [Actinacidiphila glaucinigra]|uniref:VOC family protein n=1 Tax=Actinacidiphila glaucinigra TaxID=235986 RepID=UPI003864682D
MHMKLEMIVLPVSDIDRAKAFYDKLGFRLDVDYTAGEDFRIVHFTPPGSECSIIFGQGMTPHAPGSIQGLYLIVSDIEQAHAELADRGIDVSEIFHDAGGLFHGHDAGDVTHHSPGQERLAGLHPERASYGSFLTFADPDGNGWVLQEISSASPAADHPHQPPPQRAATAHHQPESQPPGPSVRTTRTKAQHRSTRPAQ